MGETTKDGRMAEDSFGLEVTEDRWKGVEDVIRGFIQAYPLHWAVWKKDLHENQTTYQEAFSGDLKKSSWRNTASFPVVYRKMTPAERLEDPYAEEDTVEVDSLYGRLTVLLPGLTDADEKGRPNRLYREFLSRFPIFQPGEKR